MADKPTDQPTKRQVAINMAKTVGFGSVRTAGKVVGGISDNLPRPARGSSVLLVAGVIFVGYLFLSRRLEVVLKGAFGDINNAYAEVADPTDENGEKGTESAGPRIRGPAQPSNEETMGRIGPAPKPAKPKSETDRVLERVRRYQKRREAVLDNLKRTEEKLRERYGFEPVKRPKGGMNVQ